MRFNLIVLPVIAILLLNGCAAYQKMTRQEDCEKALKTYSRMIRWNEAEKAALFYVGEQQRDSFSKAAETMRRKNVNMADMRILASQCRAGRKTAEATVEFDYFTLPDNRLKTITDRQKWVFNEENPQNLNWKKDGSSLHRYRISGNRQMEQLSGHIRQFLEYLATERNGSPHTIAAYRNDLKQFESFVRAKRGEKATINDLDHLLLRLWLADLSEKGWTKTAKNR